VLVAIYRDTRGAGLSAEDRVSHFPASPMAAVTRVLHGDLRLIPEGGDWRAAQAAPNLPLTFIKGPQDTPLSSWAPGDVAALTVGIYPDAWRALGGDEDWSDLPASLARALDVFAEAQNAEDAWDRFCRELAQVWRDTHAAAGVGDWLKSLMTRAALSGSGRSLRSIERRVKRLTGSTRQTLEFFATIENLQAMTSNNPGRPLAEIALSAGYADQSHMGRAVRRATGFSPARLNRAIETEEAFWCYRLLGERF
jgi:AraC-like DNA-binding protein